MLADLIPNAGYEMIAGTDHLPVMERPAESEAITRSALPGEVWTRPGLSRRDRSFITLASLVTGGHENEIAMHIRGALTNGVTREEISEIILHTSIYAGVPAANAAFAIAREVFAQLDDVD